MDAADEPMRHATTGRPCPSCRGCGETDVACYTLPTERGTFHVVRCSRCDLVRLRENFTEADYVGFYQGGTATLHKADELTLGTYDRYLDRLERFRQTGRFLEVGVGGGDFIRRSAERGWTCFGNDISSLALDALYGLVPRENLHRGFLHQAPFYQSMPPVDACAMLGVLEHIPEPIELLTQIRRVLRPGGAVFIDVPNYAAMSRRVLGAKWGMWDVPDHVSFFTPATLESVMNKAGFDVQERWTSGFNPVDLGALFRRAPVVGTPAAPAPETRVRRRQTIDRIRRAVSHLGPTKRIVNSALNMVSAGDGLFCLGVAR